ncbi:MAG: hypothetical protein HN742_22130 [Lentisphaerae bacterium]|nr:hypothetical protein [Lentisphaerota bacterium]MBT4818089.1 hypothetical protein [Lentisphaerota bacterium]MBT5605257.1 hypothetical protein [Lentisphaerota bacterium]MBT7059236.1 hypothetical protein [Lentisphaerota bacterium]MBT7844591.1 hypothetical protein [Lentisphaerota bacterium]
MSFGAGTDQYLIAAGQGTFEAVDMMGNVPPVPVVQGVRAVMPVSATPSFLRICGSGVVPTVLGVAAALVECTAAVPGVPAAATLHVRNPLAIPATVTASWELPREFGRARGEESFLFGDDEAKTVMLRFPIEHRGDDAPRRTVARVHLRTGDGPFAVLRVPFEIATAIAVRELATAPTFDLRGAANIVSLFEADPNSRHLLWQGEADLGVRTWLTVSDRELVLRFAVDDDVHSQPFASGEIWQGDSIQIGIQVPGQVGF